MAFRLAALCLVLFCCSCGGGSNNSAPPAPVAQWGRARGNNFNTGSSTTGVTNLGGGVKPIRLSRNPIRTTPSIGFDGTVFVATESDGVFALDPNLNTLWQYNPTSSPLGPIHCSVALDGSNNSFFGTDLGYVVSLNSSGVPNWGAPAFLGSAVVGSPLLVIDTFDTAVQALFVATSDGRIVSLGGSDGQIRWQVRTGGSVAASVAFDGITLYAPSADGFLYSLSQAGAKAFPPASLGAVATGFSASPSLLTQVLAQSGLTGEDGAGHVRGFSANGTSPIWDAAFASPVRTSPAQFSRVLVQNAGNGSTNTVTVTDFLVVDDAGTGWLVDPQLATRGTRCTGGLDDLQACRSDVDCQNFPPTPGPTPTPGPGARCEAPHACQGGTNAGITCRSDTPGNCPSGICLSIAKCVGGSRDGSPCDLDVDCVDGVCDLSLFSIGDNVEASPVTTLEGTILVATAPPDGFGTLYGIEPPNSKAPLDSSCLQPAPAFCRFFIQAAGPISASPAVATDGVIFFGDDRGFFYSIQSSPE